MNFTFGNTSANTSGVGNSLFGPANTTSAFGAGNTNAAGTSVFAGTNTSSSGNTLFGTGSTGITATTSTASSGFGSGGNTLLGQASTSTPNLFGGTNSFSINSNPNATSAFGIGGALSGAPTGGFGTTATSGAFGSNPLQTAATTNLGAFGATSQSNNTPGNMSLGFASTGGFNAGSTLGSTFNAGSNSLFANKPATGQFSMGSIGQGFGSKPIGQMNAAQPLQQQQQQQQREVDPNTFIPKLFNDERDRILGEFNKLQAYWGIGKGFFAPNVPPVLFNSSQSTHKFKAIGFSEIKTPTEDENSNKIDVLIKCEAGYDQLLNSIPQYEANLKNLFGMNFNVKVENAKQLPDGKAFISISVVDTNTNKKLPTFQLVAFYEQPHVRQQFQNAFANNFIELIKPLSKHEIEEYLKVPPFGIDPALWEKAKKENPDPKKFIPVALIGFGALNARFKSQVQETDQQKLRLGIIGESIQSLQRDLSTMRAKVEECKRRNLTLSNRVLKTMIWQEIKRKKGYPILAEEDELRSKLEAIQSELNAPTKYKGCLNELICKLRHMQSQRQVTPKFNLDDKLMKELQVHLTKEQQGIEHLLELVKKDMNDLKSIKGKLA